MFTMSKMSAALLAIPASSIERRSAKRQTMVLRVGILEHDARKSFCIVKNISSHGVQVKLFGRLVPGSDVRLQIGDEDVLEGRTVWVRDQLAGIAFPAPLDATTLLRVTQKLERTKRRSTPRVSASARLLLRTGGKTYSAELRDISASGARVRTMKPVSADHSVTLDLPDLPRLKAYVRWADETELGVVFDTPIPIQIIAEWLDGRVLL